MSKPISLKRKLYLAWLNVFWAACNLSVFIVFVGWLAVGWLVMSYTYPFLYALFF